MRVAFLFPGQGSQYVGMGQDLYNRFDAAKETYIEASDILGWDMAKLCFEGPSEKLNQTEYTQPAILAASVAAWRSLGMTMKLALAVAGHSLGEYTALHVASAISFRDALMVVSQRGRFMQEAVPEGEGGMAAIVGLAMGNVEAICQLVLNSGKAVYPANYNAPDQTVIAGSKEGLKEAMAMAEKRGAKQVIPLPVSVPSHSPLMLPSCKRLEAALAAIAGQDLDIPLINNKSAKFITRWSDARASLVDQLAYPLLWHQSIRALRVIGVDLFIEIGPNRVLSGLLKRIDRDIMVMNVESPEGVQKVREALSVS